MRIMITSIITRRPLSSQNAWEVIEKDYTQLGNEDASSPNEKENLYKMKRKGINKNLPSSIKTSLKGVDMVKKNFDNKMMVIVNETLWREGGMSLCVYEERFRKRYDEPLKNVFKAKASLKENGGEKSKKKTWTRPRKRRKKDHDNFNNNDRSHKPLKVQIQEKHIILIFLKDGIDKLIISILSLGQLVEKGVYVKK
ncbi:hypothetical protein CR513_46336, partial [Mucuna pruriens]